MNAHCLCGAVRFSCPDAREIGACHCGFCRRWGGGPLLAVHCGPDVKFEATDQVEAYASSDWAQRGFCKRCGTHLYYKLLPTGEYFIPAGTFETDAFEIATQLFIDRKPDYYAFANQTATLTEQEVIEQYGTPGDETP